MALDIKYTIATLVHHYLLVMGVSSTRYDLENFRIKKSRFATVYTNVAATLLILSLPIVSLISLTFLNEYANNWVMRLAVKMNSSIRFSVVLLTILGRWKREQHSERLAHIFYNIRRNYFKKLRQPNLSAYWELRFNLCYILKFFTMILHPMTLMFAMYLLAKTSQLRNFVIALYFGNLSLVVDAVLFQYFNAMWHACKHFMILNQELRFLLERMQLMQEQAGQLLMTRSSTLCALGRLTAEDLKSIASAHKQLTALMLEFNDCFRTQTLGTLMIHLIFNIVFGYYTWVVVTGSMHVELELWKHIFGFFLYAALFADLYFLYWASEATTCSQAAPADILKAFNDFTDLPTEFQKECESFAWQISVDKFAINIAGMFNLNRHTALCFWAYILQQTIVFIQFDYENRLQNQKGVTKIM